MYKKSKKLVKDFINYENYDEKYPNTRTDRLENWIKILSLRKVRRKNVN